MDGAFLSAIVSEVSQALVGRRVVAVHGLESRLIISFDVPEPGSLVISLDPGSPAVYLGNQAKPGTVRRKSGGVKPFVAQLRHRLFAAELSSLTKHATDRIVTAAFETPDGPCSLVLALTGPSANAYLIERDRVVESKLLDGGIFAVGAVIEAPRTDERSVDSIPVVPETASPEEALEILFTRQSLLGPSLKREFLVRCRESSPVIAARSLLTDLFESTPAPVVYSGLPLDEVSARVINPKTDLLLSHFRLLSAGAMYASHFASLSEAAEAYDAAREQSLRLRRRYDKLRQRLQSEIRKRARVIEAIAADLARLGEPEHLKRFGDLLLSNLATARIEGRSAEVIDYYDPDQRAIKIDLGDHATLQEAAASYYEQYQKARRARQSLLPRAERLRDQLSGLKQLTTRLESGQTIETISAVEDETDRALGTKEAAVSKPAPLSAKRGRDEKAAAPLGRRYLSSDGYEILIGKNDAENDAITFRVARSNDVWLHAADYPGSHVLIRNPRRDAVPFSTVLEAAQLAAFFSQARKEGKAAVHYTRRKHVSKPPRSKPGLVRLSEFKTVMVEPKRMIEQRG